LALAVCCGCDGLTQEDLLMPDSQDIPGTVKTILQKLIKPQKDALIIISTLSS